MGPGVRERPNHVECHLPRRKAVERRKINDSKETERIPKETDRIWGRNCPLQQERVGCLFGLVCQSLVRSGWPAALVEAPRVFPVQFCEVALCVQLFVQKSKESVQK